MLLPQDLGSAPGTESRGSRRSTDNFLALRGGFPVEARCQAGVRRHDAQEDECPRKLEVVGAEKRGWLRTREIGRALRALLVSLSSPGAGMGAQVLAQRSHEDSLGKWGTVGCKWACGSVAGRGQSGVAWSGHR